MEEVMGKGRRRHWHSHRFPIMRNFRRSMQMWRGQLTAYRR
jgi:hypothetical protein